MWGGRGKTTVFSAGIGRHGKDEGGKKKPIQKRKWNGVLIRQTAPGGGDSSVFHGEGKYGLRCCLVLLRNALTKGEREKPSSH